MNQNEFIANEKASRDTIDVKRVYIDIADDLVAGVLLSQIIFWHLPDKEGESKLTVAKNGHWWIAKKREDWWGECRITPKQYDRAIGILEQRQMVKTGKFRWKGSPTLHVRINWDGFLPVYNAMISDDKPSFNPQGGKWNFTKGENPTLPKVKIQLDETVKSETPRKPMPAVAPTLAEMGPETTTETTTENAPISSEIGMQTVFLEQIGQTEQTENPTLPVNPGKVGNNGELQYARIIVKHFNTLHERYPDKISQDVTVPRKIESLSTRKYSAVRQWYATGKSPEEVCDALSVWVTQLKTTVGGINFFAQKPFPLRKSSKEEVAKEYDATKRLIEKLQ